MRKVQAWGELLDVAGWCVALNQPGCSLWISRNADLDLRRTGEIPSTWLDLLGRISAESIHHHSEGHLIWSGRVEECAQPEPATILTRRESEVMGWLRLGKTSWEIAIILGCAARTVEKHLANLYRKLGVKSRVEMILKTSNPIN